MLPKLYGGEASVAEAETASPWKAGALD